MAKMKEAGMEERQQSESMGEPKTCVRCGWKTWSMKSRACTYPGGIHKFGPVLGGGDTEGGSLIPEKVGPTPEPDVLERLGRVHRRMRADRQEMGAPQQFLSRETIEKAVADAIAEIEEIQGSLDLMTTAFANQSAQLRAITEAKPVEWQWRVALSINPASKWFNEPERYCKLRANDSRYEVRALAVVAPKGDKEGGGG